MIRLHLDYETYSNADIKKVGGYRYAADPSTEILMASYAFDDRPPVLWDATVDPEVPKDLMAAFLSPEVELHAFNAAFERQITRHVLGLHIPTSRWFCTMVRAWALGFSGGLAAVGEQIGLSPDKQKLSEGSKLINRFCKPAPSNRKADRYTRHTHPEEWNRFCQYCVQDTVAEREMEDLLVGYPTIPQERDLWLLDQDVNDRGLPIDLALVQGAVEIRDAEIIKLKREMNDITGLKNANSPAQLLKWLDEQGAPQPDMTKDSVERTLSVPTIPTSVREVLQCRQQASKTSVKKWDALLAATTDDGRLRGAFQFGGAQRTQRWAGRIFQPQNLPRPSRDDIDVVAGWLALRDRDLVEVIFGDVMGFLSDTIRAAITAPEEKELVVCDLGSIESRVLGWESGCTRINQTFARGLDTYKDFATELFGVRYDEVTKHQRFVSKPPTLGCFAEDTEVLTDSGWRTIVNIRTQDRLWDGQEFVAHDGVVFQGYQNTIRAYGVSATADHLFLVRGDWVPWKDLADGSIKPETRSVCGRYSNTFAHTEDRTRAGVQAAENYRISPQEIYLEGERLDASLVSTLDWGGIDQLRREWVFRKAITIASRTGSTLCADDVPTLRPQNTRTMVDVASAAYSLLQKMLFGISSLWRAGITPSSKLIGSTTTKDTCPETCDSLTGKGTRATPAALSASSTWGDSTLLGSSGGNSRPGTGIAEPSLEKSEKVNPQKRSSRTRNYVKGRISGKIPVFDVLNAGPRNRFTIRTDYGTAIVHNCGYRLGADGLMAYAESMGVTMSFDEAKHAVGTYRSTYPQVPEMWAWYDEAMRAVIDGGGTREGYAVQLSRDDNFLFLELCSGRRIAYYKPLILDRTPPWGGKPRPTITYMGMNQRTRKWERLSTHGGMATEQATQGLARDILGYHMTLVEREYQEFTLVGHVHDEVITEVQEGQGSRLVPVIEGIMSTTPPWAPGMLLGAKGFNTKRYKKD